MTEIHYFMVVIFMWLNVVFSASKCTDIFCAYMKYNLTEINKIN